MILGQSPFFSEPQVPYLNKQGRMGAVVSDRGGVRLPVGGAFSNRYSDSTPEVLTQRVLDEIQKTIFKQLPER